MSHFCCSFSSDIAAVKGLMELWRVSASAAPFSKRNATPKGKRWGYGDDEAGMKWRKCLGVNGRQLFV